MNTLAPDFSQVPQKVLVGLSGGADSVALACLLNDVGRDVTCVHVHHGLRGESADGDETFVRRLCEENGWNLVCFHACPPPNAGEAWARDVRYAFFRQAMEQTGCEALLLAHHQDDQAETLLMHLLRGTGLSGLTAMLPDAVIGGIRVMRPLLEISRRELQQYLLSRGQSWREDESNQDTRYLRNRLRLEVMPLLESMAPGAAQRMASAAQIIQGEEQLMRQWTEDFLARHLQRSALPISELLDLPLALRRRVIRSAWQGESLSQRQTEDVLHLLAQAPGAVCNLPGGGQAKRCYTHLHLMFPTEEKTSPTPCEVHNGAQMSGVTVHVIPVEKDWGDGRSAQAMPTSLLNGLTLRTRRSGDWIRPFGQTGRQSLQDYLVNRRVDAPFRDEIPLLCREDEVLLVCGVGAGALPHLSGGEDACLISFTGEMPWMRPNHQDAPSVE